MALMLFVLARHQASSADQASQRRFFELLEKNSGEGDTDQHWMRGVVRRMSHSRLVHWLPKVEHNETVQLLKQAGWYTASGRSFFYLSTWLIPVTLTIVTFIFVYVQSEGICYQNISCVAEQKTGAANYPGKCPQPFICYRCYLMLACPPNMP